MHPVFVVPLNDRLAGPPEQALSLYQVSDHGVGRAVSSESSVLRLD